MAMRQKELRIALVCYGGISLAVYMHGVTKEVWQLARASQSFLAKDDHPNSTAAVYRRLLETIEARSGMRLRILTDVVAGASAGGINGVFLAQAIHSGQSLEPLTQLWLDRADIDVLLDPDARPWTRFVKFGAAPIVLWLLTRRGNAVSASVARETRAEVRAKLSRFIRSRWFEPPFGGLGFSRLLAEALDAMAKSEAGPPLLPPGHPLDMFVTTTDFKGFPEAVRLHSPPIVEESEHRLSVGFRAPSPTKAGAAFAALPELVFAARATASFPGAFPALQVGEIDQLMRERDQPWPSRDAFLRRIMPEHSQRGDVGSVALIDGSVLVNAPFADAMRALRDKPAQREIDRRLVYIDPRPDRVGGLRRTDPRPPGFFSVIFGSLSSIPREQPMRDNLELLARQSAETARLRGIVEAIRPEIEQAVEKLFGHTLFFDRPNSRRLASWRTKAHKAAAEYAGYAYSSYARVKVNGVIDDIAAAIRASSPELRAIPESVISAHLRQHLAGDGLSQLSLPRGGATDATIDFLRDHDLPFRIRRLRLLSRQLAEDRTNDVPEDVAKLEEARETVYAALALYFNLEAGGIADETFPDLAARVFAEPGEVLARLAARRNLRQTDIAAEAMISAMLVRMPVELRRRILFAYLGFAFYDTVTLPLLRGEGLTEFNPVQVDRISPEDADSVRSGGASACLRGIEFYNFGAFFSRTYRENDYLWGRLHGAERMIDLIASTIPADTPLDADELLAFKRAAFAAILDEEESRLTSDPTLVPGIRSEIAAAASAASS